MMGWCVGAVTFLCSYSSGAFWAHWASQFVPVPYFREDSNKSTLVICNTANIWHLKCCWQFHGVSNSALYQQISEN